MTGLARAAVFAALFLFGTVPVGRAQDVVLTSRDGDIEISGNLLGFDGEFYRVGTVYGDLTIDGSGVLCDGPGCPNLEDYVAELRFSGAPSIGRVLMPALIESFALRSGLEMTRQTQSETRFTYVLSNRDTGQPRGRFHFHLTNTDEGFADLLANEADIVMSLREVRPQEVTRAKEAGIGDLRDETRSRVLALDALVPLVAPGNSLTQITLPQLAAVMTGEIINWKALGGPDAPIALHLRHPSTGLGQAAEDRLLSGEKAHGVRPDTQRHLYGSDLSAAVSKDPFALGIGAHSSVDHSLELALAGDCGFDMRATRRTVKTEDYPLTAPLFLYLPTRRFPKLMRNFLSFTSEPAAQLVIRRAGFVDQLPEEIDINAQGDRFANAMLRAGDDVTLDDLQAMVRVLTPLKRLTTTFRFEPGSVQLDAQSRSNVAQLAHALESGFYDTRRLVFVGFSDGDGAAMTNRNIAMRRANAVQKAVKGAAKTVDVSAFSLEAKAFGEAMPMACDDNEWGKRANRRVEVWIR